MNLSAGGNDSGLDADLLRLRHQQEGADAERERIWLTLLKEAVKFSKVRESLIPSEVIGVFLNKIRMELEAPATAFAPAAAAPAERFFSYSAFDNFSVTVDLDEIFSVCQAPWRGSYVSVELTGKGGAKSGGAVLLETAEALTAAWKARQKHLETKVT